MPPKSSQQPAGKKAATKSKDADAIATTEGVEKAENPYKVVPKGPATGDQGLSGIKMKIRDALRLLKRPNLPATVKQDLERRHKALVLELNSKSQSALEGKLIQKYKYVKHVEKVKVLRRINQLEKKRDADDNDLDDEEKEEIESQLKEQRLNLAYIEFFPKDMKYISLFPKTDDEQKESKDNDEDTEPAKGKKNKRKPNTANAKADELKRDTDRQREAVKERIRRALETQELKREGLELKMADIFGEDERSQILAKASLTKKGRASMTKEERLAVEKIAGKLRTTSQTAANGSDAKPQPKSKESAKRKDRDDEDEEDEKEADGEEENEMDADDFFLSGDADPEDEDNAGPIPEEEFVLEDEDAMYSKKNRRMLASGKQQRGGKFGGGRGRGGASGRGRGGHQNQRGNFNKKQKRF
ncbi:18S rRNA maturation protein [Blyttiomyces sp. JEL0837]|nr:18S rRNA maturation protein [Blyttiomyces sp. JEL0837]